MNISNSVVQLLAETESEIVIAIDDNNDEIRSPKSSFESRGGKFLQNLRNAEGGRLGLETSSTYIVNQMIQFIITGSFPQPADEMEEWTRSGLMKVGAANSMFDMIAALLPKQLGAAATLIQSESESEAGPMFPSHHVTEMTSSFAAVFVFNQLLRQTEQGPGSLQDATEKAIFQSLTRLEKTVAQDFGLMIRSLLGTTPEPDIQLVELNEFKRADNWVFWRGIPILKSELERKAIQESYDEVHRRSNLSRLPFGEILKEGNSETVPLYQTDGARQNYLAVREGKSGTDPIGHIYPLPKTGTVPFFYCSRSDWGHCPTSVADKITAHDWGIHRILGYIYPLGYDAKKSKGKGKMFAELSELDLEKQHTAMITKLLMKQTPFDLLLEMNGKEFRVHKAVMPKTVLDLLENQGEVVEEEEIVRLDLGNLLPLNIDEETFLYLLTFLYTGNCPIDFAAEPETYVSTVEKLKEAAKRFDMGELEKFCDLLLSKRWDNDDFAFASKLIAKTGNGALKNQCARQMSSGRNMSLDRRCSTYLLLKDTYTKERKLWTVYSSLFRPEPMAGNERVALQRWRCGSDHFYCTSSDSPKSSVYEGIIGYILKNPAERATALYQYLDPTRKDHYLSLVMKDSSTSVKYEGVLGYLYEEPENGTVPIFHYYTSVCGDNLYITNFNSKDWNDIAKCPGYQFRSVLGYCFQPPDDFRTKDGKVFNDPLGIV